MQIADEVSNGLVQGSGGFRMAEEVRKVPLQTADAVAEGSGTKTFQNLPRCWGSHMSCFFFVSDFGQHLLSKSVFSP